MALLNSSNYGKLADVSTNVAAKKAAGKFSPVFITGEPREGQQMGTMQSMYDFDGGKYIINNANEVYFIPYFIKRFWEKYAKVSGRDGNGFDKLVAFGWKDDVPKIDDQCKYSYVIAGLLLDSKTKKAIQMPEDVDGSGIKKGDPALISFKCGGIKFQSAMNLTSAFATKMKELKPLSDNPEFEAKIVTPRRYIVKVTIGVATSSHGNKTTYVFDPSIALPDNAVEKVMESAMSLSEDFEKQFDKTANIKAGPQNFSESSKSSSIQTFDEPKANEPDASAAGESFDLGI